MQPLVYAPSVPSRYDPISERRIPVVDLQPAYSFGDLKLLTPMENLTPEGVAEKARAVHSECARTVQPEDFVLMVGDPALISAAIAGAHTRNGFVKVLRWDRHKKDYDIMRIEYE